MFATSWYQCTDLVLCRTFCWVLWWLSAWPTGPATSMQYHIRRESIRQQGSYREMHAFVWQVVKVCDFGVTCLKPIPMSSSGEGAWTGEMTTETGTYSWLSPEVSIQRHSFTPRSNNSLVNSVLHGKDATLVMHLLVCCPTSNKLSVWVNHQFSRSPICVWNACRYMIVKVLEHKPYDHKVDAYSFGIMMWYAPVLFPWCNTLLMVWQASLGTNYLTRTVQCYLTLLVLRLLYLVCRCLISNACTCFVACVNGEVLTGGVPYDGFTPLQAAIGVVQQSNSTFFTWLFGHVDSLLKCLSAVPVAVWGFFQILHFA